MTFSRPCQHLITERAFPATISLPMDTFPFSSNIDVFAIGSAQPLHAFGQIRGDVLEISAKMNDPAEYGGVFFELVVLKLLRITKIVTNDLLPIQFQGSNSHPIPTI